jgi:hypothetical protein
VLMHEEAVRDDLGHELEREDGQIHDLAPDEASNQRSSEVIRGHQGRWPDTRSRTWR